MIKSNPKRIFEWFGLPIGVEQEIGDKRHWYDKFTQEKGTTEMKVPYGYFLPKEVKIGKDGEGLDVFVGDDYKNPKNEVYVVYQRKGPEFIKLDELKVMVGFRSMEEALQTYNKHYNNDKFVGEIRALSIDDFKDKYEKSLSKGMSDFPVIPPPPPLEDQFSSLEGVQSLLNGMGSLNDSKTMEMYKELWGPGYQTQNQKIEQIRNEIIGFLMDNLEGYQAAQMSEVAQPSQLPEQSPPSESTSNQSMQQPLPTSDSSQISTEEPSESQSPEVNSQEVSPLKSSTDSEKKGS